MKINHETKSELVLETINMVIDEGHEDSFMDLIQSVSNRLQHNDMDIDAEEVLEIYNGTFFNSVELEE